MPCVVHTFFLESRWFSEKNRWFDSFQVSIYQYASSGGKYLLALDLGWTEEGGGAENYPPPPVTTP